MSEQLVQMVGISKHYPGVQALKSVNFNLLPGEIHCLVGENGAGKSTLMKVLSGAEKADDGEIILIGEKYSHYQPDEAHQIGIATIYQETDLVLEMTVSQNIFLGHEPVSGFWGINKRQLRKDALDLMKRIDLKLSPDEIVENLSPANRQLVQIVKALSYNSKVLIMDEPGAVLSNVDLERLFKLLNQMKQEGMGIIYISHRLEEIFAIGDRVTILRDGYLIAERYVRETTKDEIIEDMVGRPLGEQFSKTPAFSEEIVLSVKGICDRDIIEDISFDLRKGEILGMAGLIGAGRSDVLKCLFGLSKPTAGEIFINNELVNINSPKLAMKYGLGFLPEDRKESGLVLDRSVQENVILTIIDSLGAFLGISFKKARAIVSKFIQQLGIKTPSQNQLVRNLSGGNQQKVVLSKWLAADSKILLLDEPTRGVDVNAKSEIYQIINQLTQKGVSVIMASSELPEILGMSDRIVVMSDGKITKQLEIKDASQVEIMKYAVPSTALNTKANGINQ